MNSDTLSRKTLLCYSAGSFAVTALYGFCGLYLLKFYTDIVGLDPRLVGYAFAVRMLLDAIFDPVIGYVSDIHRFRQGRRRPYFLVGMIPAAVLFWLVMTPPATSEMGAFAYLTAMSSLVFLLVTVMAIPFGALAYELTSNYVERTRISGYKNFAELGATLLTTFSVPLLLGMVETENSPVSWSRAQCYSIAALAVAVISVAGTFLAYYGTREPELPESQFQFRFVEGIKAAFANRPFAILLVTFTLLTVADRVAISQIFMLLEHYHGKPEEDCVPLFVAYFVGSLASIAPWSWVGKRIGKKGAFLIALCGWPFTYIALVAARWPDSGLLAVMFLMGACGTGALVLLGAMAPDVLEWDELRSGQRREGTYVAIANLMWKVALGICFIIVGQTMHWIGYEGGRTPTTEVVHGLRASFAGVPVVLSIIAIAVFSFFSISQQSHEQTLEAIAVRRREALALGELADK